MAMENKRDFTFIDNVVDANIAALTKDDLSSQVFNIASGNPQSVNNLFKVLAEIISVKIGAKYLDARIGDVRKTHADISCAKDILGWEPKVDFRKGLEKTVEWFK